MSENVRAADLARDFCKDDTVGSPTGVGVDDALASLLERVGQNKPVIETLATGIAVFDETTGGLVRGDYAGMAAGPGTGKSLFADKVVLGALNNNPEAKAVIFNLETATPVRVARLLCGAAVRIDESNAIARYISLSQLLRGRLPTPSIEYAREVGVQLRTKLRGRLRFIDNLFDAQEIADAIRSEQADIVVVDHFGLVTADWLGSSASAVERFDRGLHEVYTALRDADAAGILIAEVTKSALVTGATDLGSIRGSARFASLAGQQLTISRVSTSEQGDQIIQIELHKNRHGQPMVCQTATLYGGLGYLHFGEVSPLMIKKSKKAKSEAQTND